MFGIAADSAKVYWVMDGHNGNICRYDFVEDHGPGYDDHSAGKIWTPTYPPCCDPREVIMTLEPRPRQSHRWDRL